LRVYREVPHFPVTIYCEVKRGKKPSNRSGGKEAQMERFTTIARAPVLLAVFMMAIAGTNRAQSPRPPGVRQGQGRLPEPLPPGAASGAKPTNVPLPIPASPPSSLVPQVQPIDLDTSLRLAGVQNPELNVARQRVLEAVAMRQLAAASFLPSINPGMNYDSHTGNLQQSNGNILSVQRSAVYLGAGSQAVAAGTVNIPGVFLGGNTALGIFGYLESRQLVRRREFENIAVRNQVFLEVTLAYSELLRAEGRLAVGLQSREEARTIARLTYDYALVGRGRVADANRASTELQRREAYIKQAESEVLTSSARLCQVLNLDPSIRLHPTDAYVVPHPLVPDPIPVRELITLGLLRHPELGAMRVAIIQALLALQGAKALPFSPSFYIGFSAGGFGGGSNLVRPLFGGFGGRTDFDVIAYWTLQNLGVGNVAMIRGANANLQIRRFEQIEILNRVRSEVAKAYARTHARYAQIETNESAIRSSRMSFTEDLELIRFQGERNVLPIELLNSFHLLAQARNDYIDAIVDYNRAQFELYVALGQPPANALAHLVPTEGVGASGVTPSHPDPVKPMPRLPAEQPAADSRTSPAGSIASGTARAVPRTSSLDPRVESTSVGAGARIQSASGR
jgi:outer membrane protein TolC